MKETFKLQQAPLVAAGCGEHGLRALGDIALACFGRRTRRQQRNEANLFGMGQFDELLGAGEEFDGSAQLFDGVGLLRRRAGRVVGFQGADRAAHRRQAALEQRRRVGDRLHARRLVVGGGLHGLETPKHAAGARADVLLAVGQVLGGQPRRRRIAQRLRAESRQGCGLDVQLRLVARRRLQRAQRIQKLLPSALQFRQRGVRAPVAAFALQPPQASPRVAQGLASAFQKVGDAFELVGAASLFRRKLVGRRLLDEQALLGRQVDALADVGQQHALAARQGAKAVLEAEWFAAGLFGGDVGKQAADGVADAPLVVDQAFDAALQGCALVELIRQRENAARHQLQVDAGVVVAGRRQAHCIVEPRRALAQRVDGIRRDSVFGDAVRQREAEIESGAVAQFRVRPGVVPGGEEGLRGSLVVGAVEARQTEVVVAAGREVGGLVGVLAAVVVGVARFCDGVVRRRAGCGGVRVGGLRRSVEGCQRDDKGCDEALLHGGLHRGVHLAAAARWGGLSLGEAHQTAPIRHSSAANAGQK